MKLKNLILIMNNLLMKIKDNKYSSPDSDVINKLLFDNKQVDLNSDVDENLIQQINSSIFKPQ